MVILKINYKNYQVMDDEFIIGPALFSTLIIREKLGYYERVSGLLRELGKSLNISNSLFIAPTHGGFVPIQCAASMKHVFVNTRSFIHMSNITYNVQEHGINNFNIIDNITDINTAFMNKMIIFTEDFLSVHEHSVLQYNPVIVSKINKNYSNYVTYHLSNTDLYVLIPEHLHTVFVSNFKYFIKESSYELEYNNLINLCIMVKNGGALFEEMLTQNLPYIDYWTILDTGSTDNTIANINRILVGKKGALHQEPFINFGESRNRCLTLAGTQCKYNVMLDDSYVIKGFLREFLDAIRGDQFADSYSLYINQNEIEYASNRIFKSEKNLKYLYSIHEVVQDYDNVNVLVPSTQAHIYDIPCPEMLIRTSDRKENDLVLLKEEIQKNPSDPRPYYYLAQTYSFLQDFEKAYEYYLKRGNHPEEGFIQEKVNAFLEAGRIGHFTLKKPWSECEILYKRCYELDDQRPEALYFLGLYYFEQRQYDIAYDYLLKGFKNGYPAHRQYCLKPTLCFHFLPKLLVLCCHEKKSYETGEKVSTYFLEKNKPTDENYDMILDLHKIFVMMNKSNIQKALYKPFNYPSKPLCVFVVPGGFNKWTGRDILSKGMGGSETYVVEMSRYIQLSGDFQVIVFCDCETADVFEDVEYRPLEEYFSFVHYNYIHTCIISRYSEFLPVALEGQTENVYLVVHDLTLTGKIVPKSEKLKNVFCLTEWHYNYFLSHYPDLKDITVVLGHGININSYLLDVNNKIPYKFIYSSMPNRGLLPLLIMWSKIHAIEPSATLHIYSDINSKYMLDTCPELMQIIKNHLDSLKNSNVFYHGWVDKKTLQTSWKTADVWFYPCTYMETFCLTALEAAASKTLAVTTDLAGLQTTVGDRGVILHGQPNTVEWFDSAITKLFNTLKNPALKNALIEKNYKWVSDMSWYKQANILSNVYLKNNILEYRGMYNWTNDIPKGTKQVFENVIHHFNKTHMLRDEPYKILEIGTYSGTSLIKIVQMIPNSAGFGIDAWKNYGENDLLTKIEETGIAKSFLKNVESVGLERRVCGICQDSTIALINMLKYNDGYDFIYVDGSHKLLDCYTDLVLSWRLLKSGGIMGIDDYLWNNEDLLGSPFESVNHFLKKYETEMTVLVKDYRVFIEKK
jgi:tetratricopeptide (TPR) repeat protein